MPPTAVNIPTPTPPHPTPPHPTPPHPTPPHPTPPHPTPPAADVERLRFRSQLRFVQLSVKLDVAEADFDSMARQAPQMLRQAYTMAVAARRQAAAAGDSGPATRAGVAGPSASPDPGVGAAPTLLAATSFPGCLASVVELVVGPVGGPAGELPGVDEVAGQLATLLPAGTRMLCRSLNASSDPPPADATSALGENAGGNAAPGPWADPVVACVEEEGCGIALQLPPWLLERAATAGGLRVVAAAGQGWQPLCDRTCRPGDGDWPDNTGCLQVGTSAGLGGVVVGAAAARGGGGGVLHE